MRKTTTFTRPDPTRFIGFEGIQTEKLKVHRYILGERPDKLKGLTTYFYDQIQFVCKSKNAKNKKEFISAIGWTKSNNEYTPLILKIK